MEDASQGEFPHPRTRVTVRMGPTFFSAHFSDRQQEILTRAHDHEATVGELLDTFPETDGRILDDLSILREEGVLSFQAPSSGVRIVTDSTSDLPSDVRRRLGIEVVPLSVLFGDTRYVDGVTLRPRRFYELLESDAPHPSTEPPSAADFGRALRGLSARELADRVPGLAERLQTLFVVDTLEYLAKGGRIGKARAFIGGMLGIKPILSFDDGQVGPIDRVRGGRAAHPRILQHLRERLSGERPLICGIAHAKAPVWADRLRRLVEDAFEVDEMILTEIGPVVGTHGGPGTVGVVAFEPTEEERELLAPIEEPS